MAQKSKKELERAEIYYSPSTGGFYPSDMKKQYEQAQAWPEDAVRISEEEYHALLTGQSAGQRIAHDTEGKPVLVEQEKRPSIRQSLVDRILADPDELAKLRAALK